MGHNHSNERGKKLGVTIILNISITLAQYVGGLLTGSLALMSDAAHNFSDVIALIVSWIADKLARTDYSARKTYGLRRAEIIAAVINVSTIIYISLSIFFEAINRLTEPAVVSGKTVMILAGLSILVNGLSVLIVKNDAKENTNMKSAYLHLLSDMLTSIAVLIVGIIMYFYEIYWLDSVVSIAIALFLFASSFKLLFDTIKVLMQFVPDHINIEDIAKAVSKNKLIESVHHMHIWQLTDNEVHMSAHIDLSKDISMSETNQLYDDVTHLLMQRFGVNHTTLQLEYKSDHKKEVIYTQSCN